MNDRVDSATFNALYSRHAADIFRFALYLCGDRDDAEDITSETFVRVWTSSTPLRGESVKAYLLTIARNLYLHGRRREKRRATLSDEITDPRTMADAGLDQRDQLAAVLAELSRLGEVDRSALLMHAAQGVTYQQIADALGISLASVKIRIHRARLALAHIG